MSDLEKPQNSKTEQTIANRTLKAGVSKRNITTDTPGAGIRDPLYIKVLVMDDGATRLAILAMDTTAVGGRSISCRMLDDVGEEFLPHLRSRMQKELGIAPNHVLVNASHTHPPGRLLCSDEEQVKRAFDAVRQAIDEMVPVTVGSGIGREDRITMNRTLRLKDGRHWTIRHSNPCPPDDQVAGLGPVDPDIGVLRIDRLDGRPLALVYNFACHLLFGDPQGTLTANIPGVASKLIEDTLGDGALAIFLQGTAGDVIDVTFKDFTRPRDIEPLGLLLGQSTLKAWRDIRPKPAPLGVVARTLQFPRRTDIPQRIEALQREQAELLASLRFTALNFKSFLPLYLNLKLNPDCPSDYSFRYWKDESVGAQAFLGMDDFNRKHVEKYLRNLQAMEALARIQDDIETLKKHQEINNESGEATIAAEVMGIRIGECVIISSPAELLTQIGLNVKKASPYPHTFVAAFSNGYLHYGAPACYYDKGGYEVTECLLAPEWQAMYEKAAEEIIRQL